ncbi:sensor histidine kinase [Thioclava sp. JE_KL1]|nr:sensor histidine kinase [Thioclava sp. JE_KL1]
MRAAPPTSALSKAMSEPRCETPPVLILAPLNDDARALARLVERTGLSARTCVTARDLASALDARGPDGVLFVVVSQEGASQETGEVLNATFAAEPAWARLPSVFLLSRVARLPPAVRAVNRKENAPSPILLERPVKAAVLQSVFEAQAEARRRQFETRDLIDRLSQEEERGRFLLSELRHRTRNSLTVLQSLFSMTVRRAPDLESFSETFYGRLRALTDAHVKLAQEGATARPLGDLVSDHVEPYTCAAEQLHVEGPSLLLTERLSFDLALVIHELATNAAKYGALTVPEGRVSVRWRVLPESAMLALSWEERDGPRIEEPPSRQGLGSQVIDSFMRGEAETELRHDPDGVSWYAKISPRYFTSAADNDLVAD